MSSYGADTPKTLKSPNETLQGRLGNLVSNEGQQVEILRRLLIRLRGSTPEPVNPSGVVPTPRDIPAMEHLQRVEALQDESLRLARQLDDII